MGTQPIGRFEWERIIRRITTLTTHEYAIAMTLASYADYDGTRIFPGTERLARTAKMGRSKTLQAVTRLRSDGLIERVRSRHVNGPAGGYDEYRLTIPSDIFSRFPLLGPDDSPAESGGLPQAPASRELSTARVSPRGLEHLNGST